MLYRASQLIELTVPQASTQLRVQFNDIPYLRNNFIDSIEVFTVTDMPLSPSGNAVITAANLKGAFLTLWVTDEVRGAGEYIQLLPLSVLHYLQNSANDPFERNPFLLNNRVISWDKCYITLAAALGNSGAPVSFMFNVGFSFNPANTTN
jgi:hypothetical protein